jgi:hypothetical protein
MPVIVHVDIELGKPGANICDSARCSPPLLLEFGASRNPTRLGFRSVRHFRSSVVSILAHALIDADHRVISHDGVFEKLLSVDTG